MSKRNNIIIPQGTEVTISRDGGAQRSYTTTQSTEFADWSSNRNGTLTARQIVRGVCWEVVVSTSKVQIVPIRSDVAWSEVSAEHDRVHAQGQGHKLSEALRIRKMARAAKVVRLDQVREAFRITGEVIAREVKAVTMDEVAPSDLLELGLLGDLEVTPRAHLTRRLIGGGVQVTYDVPSSQGKGMAHSVHLTERRGRVLRVDCGCVRALRYRKCCSHGRRARRAHQRLHNAHALLREGMHPMEVVDLLTGAADRAKSG